MKNSSKTSATILSLKSKGIKMVFFSVWLFAIQLSPVVQAGIGNKINDKAERRADPNNEAISKGLNEPEEEVIKKPKNEKEKGGANKENTKKKAVEEETPVLTGTPHQNSKDTVPENFTSYSKFDFVPGDKVIFFDDFSQDNIGDFPVKWNTNGKGEVVTGNLYPGKWLKMRNATTYLPDIASAKFPENYTIEYDMIANGEDRSGSFNIELTGLPDKNKVPEASDPTDNTGLFIRTEMAPDGAIRYLASSTINVNGERTDGGANTDINDFTIKDKAGEKFHVSIAVNKTRFRLYINEVKVLDLPKVMPQGNYNAVVFRMWGWAEDHPFEALLSNFRYAEGTTDVRSKLLTEGKLVTRGILFNVSSDKIKPESYGTIKEIADVLKANPAVKVMIVGHTDSDGDDKANLDLSKRRATAVKNALSKDFGIDGASLQTDGKGESIPASPNTTPEGKASNRRVEFIKL